MTSFFAWNMRGFNMPRKQTVVQNWIQAFKPCFGCFLETRVQESNSGPVLNNVVPGWSSLTNYDHHRLGRIWVCWSADVVITPILKNSQHITCSVTIANKGITMVCSFVYASKYSSERRLLWTDLCYVRSTLLPPSTPWIVIGDFNEILTMADHSRATDYAINRAGMNDFQNVVEFCDITDLSSSGPGYTWTNNQESNPIGKKLDRALINPAWLSLFSCSHASFDVGGISDHTRCFVNLSSQNANHRKPFKFF